MSEGISTADLHRRFLLRSVSYMALSSGMIAAEEKARVLQIDSWIKEHPQKARELSAAVEAGKYGDVRK